MSWTAVQQRACEAAAMSGTVRRTAVAFRMGVGDRAHQYRESVSFLCGRDPRVPPSNAAGQRSLRLPGGSQQRRNGIPKAFSQEFSISSGIGSKSVAQAVKRSIPNMRRSSGTSTIPQRQMPFAPKHGEADSSLAQLSWTSKHETPACGLAGSSHCNACAARNRGD